MLLQICRVCVGYVAAEISVHTVYNASMRSSLPYSLESQSSGSVAQVSYMASCAGALALQPCISGCSVAHSAARSWAFALRDAYPHREV